MADTRKLRTVTVDVKPRAYPIYIEPGALASLGARLRDDVPSRRVAIITDGHVGPIYGEPALQSLREAGFEPTLITVPAGESSKSLDRIAGIYDAVADARLDRTSTIVALGGGMIGDLTGFVAATWMRGVHFVQCPTTVLADVDASVGGKTGINHRSGKNMIGAFYQPRFVLIDTAVLHSLDEREFRAGLAESVKHAIIKDAEFFKWHEDHASGVLAYDADALGELFEHNVRIKAAVVAEDEREVSGVRALLNFGHTVGHAIETAMARRGDAWPHGECVSAGMVAAAEISVAAGRLNREEAQRIVTILRRIGLPTEAPLANARDEIKDLMRSDKKVAVGKLRFVLADHIGQATLYSDIQPAWIEAGLDSVLT